LVAQARALAMSVSKVFTNAAVIPRASRTGAASALFASVQTTSVSEIASNWRRFTDSTRRFGVGSGNTVRLGFGFDPASGAGGALAEALLLMPG